MVCTPFSIAETDRVYEISYAHCNKVFIGLIRRKVEIAPGGHLNRAELAGTEVNKRLLNPKRRASQ